MYDNLLTFAQQAAAPTVPNSSALLEALRISGIGMLAIFFVMGLFGAMITLLSKVFPEAEEESE